MSSQIDEMIEQLREKKLNFFNCVDWMIKEMASEKYSRWSSLIKAAQDTNKFSDIEIAFAFGLLKGVSDQELQKVIAFRFIKEHTQAKINKNIFNSKGN